MIIIGSTALGNRTPKDLDLIGTLCEYNEYHKLHSKSITNIILHNNHHYSFKQDDKWVEFEIAYTGNSSFDYLNIMNSHNIIENIPLATKEILFSIKKSHIHFPINFYKHIEDYLYLKDLVGKDIYTEITKKRFKETENRLGELKTPSLSKKSKDFFNQSSKFVKSYFIHDDIHSVMAHLDKPLYEYMQPDKTSAFCSKDLWNNFSDDWKDWCVMEEAYVIALERKVLPSFYENKICNTDDSFKWSLMRISTTLCSGFFREWATNRFNIILNKYNKDYFLKFLDAVDDNRIKETMDNKNFIELNQ